MASGPSKEELKMYWESSRQYFDELANYYKTADPAYYNEYIAPFYSNPFTAVSSGTKGSTKRIVPFISVFLFVVIGLIGGAVYFLSSTKTTFKDVERKYEQPDVNKEVSPPVDDEKNILDDEFIIGSKYLQEKDYDKAEEHLRKVRKDSEYYELAQQMLKNMDFLRKHDPKK